MNKRERMFRVLSGPAPSVGVPAAFFLHFDASCRSGRAAIDKHIEFFRFTGMDFVKIQLELPFPQMEINGPADWASLPYLRPEFYEPQIEVVKGLVEALAPEAPVLLTLYSPFMVAAHMGNALSLAKDLDEAPAEAKVALELATESLLAFVRMCHRAGLDGFYHSTQGGESRRFQKPETFATCVKPYDLALMKEIERTFRFNILHICDYHRAEVGGYDDLEVFRDYPGHVVNIGPEIGGKTLTMAEIAKIFGRPVMGGLDRTGILATGAESEVRSAACEALSKAPERFILGADCTVPGDTPWDNLRTAIEVAHGWSR